MASPTLAQHALNIPRSGIRDVFDRADQIPDVISLCVGEPQDTAAEHIVLAAQHAIAEGKTKYTNVLGIEAFREAACAYSAEVKGIHYNPELEVQAVDGATIGLYLALKAVVDQGSEVIIPSPFFTSYDAEVMMCGGTPVMVPLRPENGMRLNADDIEAAITPHTRAIIINSPGNPTGAVTSKSELEKIAQLCMRYGIWAISDEVYHSFVYGKEMDIAPSIAAVPGMHEYTIVVESLSKTFAMTGWRIGYLLAPNDIIELTGKIAELMHSSVNSVAQYAGTAAMAGTHQHIHRMKSDYAMKRQMVIDSLQDCKSLGLTEPQGAFYAFVDIRPTGMQAELFSSRLLEEEHVAVVPGEAFGKEGAGFIRLSYAGDTEELREGLQRLRAFADRTYINPDLRRHTAAFHQIEIMA